MSNEIPQAGFFLGGNFVDEQEDALQREIEQNIREAANIYAAYKSLETHPAFIDLVAKVRQIMDRESSGAEMLAKNKVAGLEVVGDPVAKLYGAAIAKELLMHIEKMLTNYIGGENV